MSSLKVAVASIIHPQGLRMGLVVVCGLSSLVLAGPRMTVFTPVHEFGDIWDVDTLPCEFDFVNTGDTPLIIERVHPGCGCTTTTLDKLIYAPGESGTIDATFKPNATGQLSKTVTVLSNDSESPTTTLYLRANVTPFVRTSPRLAKLPTMMLGAGGYTDVLLTPAEATFVFGDTIRTHGPTSKHMKAQLLPPPEGAPAHAKLLRINVLPSAPWGDVQCFVTVTGKASPGPDSPDIPQKPHDVKITALGAVQGQLMSDTTTFMFGGVKPGESFEKRIRITRRRRHPISNLGPPHHHAPQRHHAHHRTSHQPRCFQLRHHPPRKLQRLHGLACWPRPNSHGCPRRAVPSIPNCWFGERDVFGAHGDAVVQDSKWGAVAAGDANAFLK